MEAVTKNAMNIGGKFANKKSQPWLAFFDDKTKKKKIKSGNIYKKR